MPSLPYIGFSLAWLLALYLLNCLISRSLKRINLKQAVLYFCTTAMIGLFGEIFLDTFYKWAFGTPLWRYNVAPIHLAYTSSFAIVTWGLYGFHLYLLHGTLRARSISKSWHLALIISVEALFLEAALTLSAKPFFGDFMYYYYPNGLWHVSAFQNIPFYFIFGFVIINVLRRFQTSPRFFSILAAWLTFIIAFMTV